MIYTYAENGEFYIRVETDDNIEYITINELNTDFKELQISYDIKKIVKN